MRIAVFANKLAVMYGNYFFDNNILSGANRIKNILMRITSTKQNQFGFTLHP